MPTFTWACVDAAETKHAHDKRGTDTRQFDCAGPFHWYNDIMSTTWNQLEELAARWPQLTAGEREGALQLARTLHPEIDELPRLFELSDALAAPRADGSEVSSEPRFDPVEVNLIDALLNSFASTSDRDRMAESRLTTAYVGRAAELYRQLGSTSRARYVLLQWLAADGRPAAMRAFADCMSADPPSEPRQIGMAFLPLFQRTDYAADALFPQLLDSLARPETATLALEVANYGVRQHILPAHPAKSRANELAALLGGVAQRLLQLEENPQGFSGTPEQARQAVSDWIALAITLCQALGLIKEPSVAGKLEQTLGVRHRRLRTEAAAALAQLGEKRGFETLVEAATEPATRVRALATLEELGELQRVAEEHRTPTAKATAEMAEWLARPTQFGVPPLTVDVIDQCRQYWPGFNDPVDCYLVSFEYHFPQGEYSNVGIVGPVTHAITTDLEDLVPSDIYAVFAGWQAEHEEIQEQDASSLTESARHAANTRLQELAGQDFAQIELVKVGTFFGEVLLVATAVRHGVDGTVIVDGAKVEWYPRGSGRRSIGPLEAYWMHKGRKLLAAFNPTPAPAE